MDDSVARFRDNYINKTKAKTLGDVRHFANIASSIEFIILVKYLVITRYIQKQID